jgi:hypothetical protein
MNQPKKTTQGVARPAPPSKIWVPPVSRPVIASPPQVSVESDPDKVYGSAICAAGLQAGSCRTARPARIPLGFNSIKAIHSSLGTPYLSAGNCRADRAAGVPREFDPTEASGSRFIHVPSCDGRIPGSARLPSTPIAGKTATSRGSNIPSSILPDAPGDAAPRFAKSHPGPNARRNGRQRPTILCHSATFP